MLILLYIIILPARFIIAVETLTMKKFDYLFHADSYGSEGTQVASSCKIPALAKSRLRLNERSIFKMNFLSSDSLECHFSRSAGSLTM